MTYRVVYVQHFLETLTLISLNFVYVLCVFILCQVGGGGDNELIRLLFCFEHYSTEQSKYSLLYFSVDCYNSRALLDSVVVYFV